MNVLMISRSTLFSSAGGDTVQVVETASGLQKLGVSVDIKLTNERIEYSGYDLIHFFNIIRPGDILRHIHKSDLPFVVSTIFVDYEEFEKRKRGGLSGYVGQFLSSDNTEYLKAIARWIVNGERIGSFSYLVWGHRASVKTIIKKAAILLPNSKSEIDRLFKKYQVQNRHLIVPNAINSSVFSLEGPQLPREGVICVGRVEPRKNQLNLIKALNELGISGFIVGKPSPNNLTFYEDCKRLAARHITFVDHISQEDLVNYYRRCRVHVLASWFETTGLSSLEAGAEGCNIVVSEKGDTRDYFGDYASYCDPSSVESIKQAIMQEYKKCNPNKALQNLIRENYTWDKAAIKTLEAYKVVLEK